MTRVDKRSWPMVDRRQFFTRANLLKVRSALTAKMGMETKIPKAIHFSLHSLKRQHRKQNNLLAVLTPNKPIPEYFLSIRQGLENIFTGKGCSEESCEKVGRFCGGPFKTTSAGVNCLHVE